MRACHGDVIITLDDAMLASLGQYFAILCRRTACADDKEPTAPEASAVFRAVAKEYLSCLQLCSCAVRTQV